MSSNKYAKNSDEFDRRFDEGEDIHDLVDMTRAKIIRHGRKVRITLDIAEELVQAFEERDHLFLALAPEGTRKWKPHWKSGFYRIAKAAEVPITLAFIDYERKQIGIGPTLPDGRTMNEDLATIREFYAGVKGRHPALQGPVEFPPE